MITERSTKIGTEKKNKAATSPRVSPINENANRMSNRSLKNAAKFNEKRRKIFVNKNNLK